MIQKLLQNATILDPVEGTSYVFDATGQKIGWYNHDKNLMIVQTDYAYTEMLCERLKGKVQIAFREPENLAEILYSPPDL